MAGDEKRAEEIIMSSIHMNVMTDCPQPSIGCWTSLGFKTMRQATYTKGVNIFDYILVMLPSAFTF